MSLGELTATTNDHSERIAVLEEGHKHTAGATSKLEKKIDRLQHSIIGVLGTALVHLILALIRK